MANWVSRLGDAYDSFKKWDNKNVWGPGDTLGAVGGAYSAASNSIVGEAIGALAKPIEQGMNVLGYPLDKVKRGIATGGMIAQGESGSTFSAGDWHEAWNRSEDISAGQVLDIGLSNDIANIPGVQDDRPDFFTAPDPYDEASRKAREDYFHNDWVGKLNSGGIDLALDFGADPLAGASSLVKTARVAKTTIKAGDRVAALAASKGETVADIAPSAAKSGDRLKTLYTKTDNLSAAEMAKMPEFKKSGDAGAIAYFMEFANKEFANDEALRHGFKADIMGSVLGDVESIERVKNFHADIGTQIQAAGSAPKQMKYLSLYSHGDYGSDMIAAGNADEAKTLDLLKADRTRDMARLDRVLDVSGSTNKIGSTLGEKFAANASLDKMDQRFTAKGETGTGVTDRIREFVKPNGLFGSPVRYVIGKANMRVPGYVDIKDPTKGYEDLLNTLSQMKHTDVQTKRQLANDFVSAADEEGRRAVIDNTEATMFRDYGRKFGVSEKAVQQFMQDARGRRSSYQQGIKDRLYSAAEPDKVVQFYDPEEDMTHVFDKAFLTTHFESHAELTEPSVLHDVLSKGTNRRVLERFAKMNPDAKGLATATKVSNFSDASIQSTTWLMNHGTRLWKDAALMRLAYPARIQIDTQARTFAHLGMMQYMMTRKRVVGGQVKYLLEDAEGEKHLKDIFTTKAMRHEGNLIGALAKQLVAPKKEVAKGKNLVEGHDIYPAKDLEDVERIGASFESHGGAAADIGNDIVSADLRKMRGNGSWDTIKAGKPEWFENWKRAADQIRTSPTARKSLELDEVDTLREWVNSTPEGRKEWSSVQGSNKSQDEWLSKVINHSNQYLPTPELRAKISNPDSARDLFDLRGAEERVASIGGLKAKKDTLHETVGEIRQQLKGKKAEYEALPKRSAERRALNVEIKALREKGKTAKNDRWQARAEYGDAKKPPTPGEVNPVSGKVEPMDVHGENYSPLGKPNGIQEYSNDLRDRWYKIAADIPETIMGRAPIYVDSYKQYMTDAIGRLGSEGVDSVGIDRIRRAADRRARQEVGEILFDASHTSNAAHAMRLIAPFFSAWEDTMRKWGKLMYENPTIPLNAHKMWDAPEAAGYVHDSEGSYKRDGKYYNTEGVEITKEEYGQRGEYIVLPKLWGGNSKDPHQGGTFKLNRDNLNVLFQGNPPWLPGLGPLVQIPTNEIVRRNFTEYADNPVLKYALPFGTTDDSVPYQLLPSWMKQVRDSMGGSKDYAQTYAMLFAQENALFETGQRKSKPTPEEVGRRAKMWFLTKAALGNTSPVSIQPTPKLQFYIDQAHTYRAKYGAKWQEKFYDDFPQYYDLSLSLSYNETGIQATLPAYNALKNPTIRKSVRANPELGWMFVGADNLNGDFNANVNTWQRSTEAGQGKNFRSSKNPDAALREVQAEKGWIQYDKMSRNVELVMESRGLHSLQQKGAEDLADLMKEYREYLGSSNTAWQDAYGKRDMGKLQHAVTAAKQAWAADPEFAKRGEQQKLASYLRVREALRGYLQTRKVTGLDNPANADVDGAWQEYVSGLKRSSPGFEQIWNRLLQADDLSQEIQ